MPKPLLPFRFLFRLFLSFFLGSCVGTVPGGVVVAVVMVVIDVQHRGLVQDHAQKLGFLDRVERLVEHLAAGKAFANHDQHAIAQAGQRGGVGHGQHGCSVQQRPNRSSTRSLPASWQNDPTPAAAAAPLWGDRPAETTMAGPQPGTASLPAASLPSLHSEMPRSVDLVSKLAGGRAGEDRLRSAGCVRWDAGPASAPG